MDCHQILLPTPIRPLKSINVHSPGSPQKNIGLLKSSEEMKTNQLLKVFPKSDPNSGQNHLKALLHTYVRFYNYLAYIFSNVPSEVQVKNFFTS